MEILSNFSSIYCFISFVIGVVLMLVALAIAAMGQDNEPKKERFDPKTLNPFDRVLVRSDKDCAWHINIYSHKNNHDKNYPYNCIMSYFKYCIPYNDDTKHLEGTEEEAPDFYKYWED